MGLPQRYDAAEAERRWQTAWAESHLYEFDPHDPRPVFAIDTPPPTVSGDLHIGHVYSYVQAEAMARFWRMQGYNLYYPFGFDDNGLPTERYVEKRRNIRARDLSRAEFIAACLEVSRGIEDRFEVFWKQLGFSVDWRLRYSTIDPQARRISQWSFLDLYRKGLIYRAQAPNPWCVECQTAIAQAEMDDAERGTTFYTLAFSLGAGQPGTGEAFAHNDKSNLVERANASPMGTGEAFARNEGNDLAKQANASPLRLAIATTRPELLPACVAVFVHPDDARFAHLIGQAATVPLFERQVPILADRAVDPQKGTGAVMCCTFGDTTDVEWWRAHQLPLIPLVTRQGRLSADGGPYAGASLAEARKRIVADLRARDLMLGEQPSRQSVRIHERCKTPLEILETSQWFVRVLDAKEALIEAGRKITWHPQHMQTRYEHWVANLGWDWCISRQRFYGVPFPLWHCDACGATILADEAQLPVDPLSDAPPHPCECGNTNLRPETDVMDTWATSSVSPQIAALRWGEASPDSLHDPLYQRLFPMQLRPQAHDIIRTWAFYTIVKSHYHFATVPWETVMISGHGLDSSGHSIHKSLGNSPIAPEALIARHGADAVRYWACHGSVGADQPINEATMKQGARLVTKLWNAARLIEAQLPYDGKGEASSQIGSSSKGTLPLDAAPLLPPDRALLSWLQRLIADATASFRAYDYSTALEATERFFWGTFCDNYLEWVKARLYDGGAAERRAAQITLAHTLLAILKLLAPFMPHITEEIYQQLCSPADLSSAAAGPKLESLHTSAWPQPDDALHDPAAERAGAAMLAITSAARRFKSARKLGLGAELASLKIALSDSELLAALEQSQVDLQSVTRARTITFTTAPGENSEEAAPGLWVDIE